jgi:Cu(I)/Ag(I) efflux system membrane fusion protein
VQPGQVLAYVRAPELERLTLDAATAELDLRLAQNELDRVEELAKSGIRNPRELLAARNRVQERQNALLVAGLKLKALGLHANGILGTGNGEPSTTLATSHQAPATSQQLLPILSPAAGIVAHLDIALGMIVDPQQHLFDIVDASRLRFRVDVPEAYVPQIAIGQEVRIRLRGAAADSKPMMGKVAARAGRVDSKSLTETVWVPAPPDPALRPGMTSLAQIIVHRQDKSLVVPDAAVVRDGIEAYVFVLVQPPTKTQAGLYERKFVTLGLDQDGVVEIKTGLFSIDSVVTTGQRQLATLFVQGVLRPSAEARKNVGLMVELVGLRPISDVLLTDALLELPPIARAVVAAPLGGKIVRVTVPVPQRVAASEPLAEIASLDFQSLQLDLIQAELSARLHQATLDSYARVELPAGIQRQLVQEAETNLLIARARVESLTRRLAAIGLTAREMEEIRTRQQVRSSFWLRAPLEGQVIPAELAVGQVVKEGAALFEVRDTRKLWVRGRLYDHELARVREGQLARLRLASLPGFVAEARVARVETFNHQGDLVRAAWLEVDNASGRLVEGMLGRLAVATGPAAESLAVPITALQREGRSWSVFVYDAKKDQFVPRQVEVGRQDDRFAEIHAGLQPREEIAVTAVADLRRGYGRVK